MKRDMDLIREILLKIEEFPFLDAARDDKRWNRAREIMKKSGDFAIDVLAMLLKELAKEKMLTYLP